MAHLHKENVESKKVKKKNPRNTTSWKYRIV